MEYSGQNLKWRQPRCVSSLPISLPACRHFPHSSRRHTSSPTKTRGIKTWMKDGKIWSLSKSNLPLKIYFFNSLPSATSASALNHRRPFVSLSEIEHCNRTFILHLLIPNNFNIFQLQSYLDLFPKNFDPLRTLLVRGGFCWYINTFRKVYNCIVRIWDLRNITRYLHFRWTLTQFNFCVPDKLAWWLGSSVETSL